MEDIAQIQLFLDFEVTSLDPLWRALDTQSIELNGNNFAILPPAAGALTVWPRTQLACPLPHPEARPPYTEVTLAFDRAGQTVMKSAFACAYNPDLGAALGLLLKRLVDALPHTAMFLSDEAGDGQSWGSLTSRIPRNRWWFDWAYIPKMLSQFYQDPPSTHPTFSALYGQIFVREPSWMVSPW